MKTSVKVLLESIEHINFSALKASEQDDIENIVANVMPQVYFTTCFDCKDLKEQHKLRRSCESEGQILDSAIHSFFDLSIEKKFCGLFKRRYLISPSSMQRRTPNTSLVEPGPL